jgi:hypothetical protein
MSSIPKLQDDDTDDSTTAPTTEYVTILKAEWDELHTRLAAVPVGATNLDESATSQERVERGEASDGTRTAGRDRPEIRSRDTEVEEAASTHERRLSELERTCKAAVKDRELATTLAGRSLVPGAAAQLIKLWRDEFDVIEEQGEYRVMARDGRSVTQAVSDWLASSPYSHFCLPTSRGGTGARDTNRPANPSAASSAPRNLGEAVVMKWRDESARRSDNLLKPIGLRRYR